MSTPSRERLVCDWLLLGAVMLAIAAGVAVGPATTTEETATTAGFDAGTDAAAQPELVVNETYDVDGLRSVAAIEALPDGGYLLGGTVDTQSDNRDVVVLEVSEDGSLESTRQFGGTDDERLVDMVRTTDGGYAFLALRQDADGSSAWIQKVDESGNTVYGELSISTSPSAMVPTEKGGVALVGVTSDQRGRNVSFYKLDAEGEITSSRVYQHPENRSANDIVRSPGGGYLLVGTEGSFALRESSQTAWASRIATNGDQEWTETLRGGAAGSVVRANDGGYVIAGLGLTAGIGGERTPWYQKIDPGGEQVLSWSSRISCRQPSNALSRASEGYVFVRSTCSDVLVPGVFNGVIEKRTESGEQAWNRTLGVNRTSGFAAITWSVNGAYAAVGTTDDSAWLVTLPAPERPIGDEVTTDGDDAGEGDSGDEETTDDDGTGVGLLLVAVLLGIGYLVYRSRRSSDEYPQQDS